MNWVRHGGSATFEGKSSYCRVAQQGLPCCIYTAVARLGFKRRATASLKTSLGSRSLKKKWGARVLFPIFLTSAWYAGYRNRKPPKKNLWHPEYWVTNLVDTETTMGITCGVGIIFGRGSFALMYIWKQSWFPYPVHWFHKNNFCSFWLSLVLLSCIYFLASFILPLFKNIKLRSISY